MSTTPPRTPAVDDAEATRLLREVLTGRKLPRWAPVVVAAGTLALALVLTAVGPVLGLVWWVLWPILFLIGQTAWSFAVEGRRHAIDRIATTFVYATFLAAVVPLTWVLVTVVTKGFKVLSLAFFAETMRNVSPRREGGGVRARPRRHP